MRLLVIFLFILLVAGKVPAQKGEGFSASDSASFYEIRKAFSKARENGKLNEDQVRLFKRWTRFMAPRVYPTGEPFRPERLWEAYERYFEGQDAKERTGGTRSSKMDWQYLGPSMIPQNGGGAGRANCIEIEPGDKSEYWVGSPHGGLWHSTNGGTDWEPMTDQLPDIGVTDLAIDPSDTSIMYLASGDGYGYPLPNSEFWGGTYSVGVLKSTDGGTSWDTTGLSFSKDQIRQVYSLLIHSPDPDTLFASTNDGLYRSIDQGQSWVKVLSGKILDLDQDHDDPAILYASSATGIYRSQDDGNSWNQVLGPFSGASNDQYAAVATSQVTPDEALAYIYGEGFYKTTDNGITWNFIQNASGLTTLGWYTGELTASPNTANTYYFGGLDIYRTTDGGSTWNEISDWQGSSTNYAHADHRDLEFVPGTNELLSANDGGIFYSSDGGSTWSDLSEGLEILQIYDMEASDPDPYAILAGTQDNGTSALNNGTWTKVLGGDGTGCAFRPKGVDTFYVSSQNGNYYRVDKKNGISYSSGNISNSPFITLLEYGNAPDSSYLYTGGQDLKNIEGNKLTNTFSDPRVRSIGLSRFNPEEVYCTMGAALDAKTPEVHHVRSSGTANEITQGLPVSQVVPTDITAHPYHPDTAWVVFSGFVDGEKAYYTENGGQDWSNISNGLPNVPVNTIVQDARDTAQNSLYAGTDLGVFYRNDSLNQWIPVMQNLPKVLVYDLDIHYGAEKIRAATFGRGIWESDLYIDTAQKEPDALADTRSLYEDYRIHPNPTRAELKVRSEEASARMRTLTLYSLSGRQVLQKEMDRPARRVKLDLETLSEGTYFLRIGREEGDRPVVKKVVIQGTKK